MWQKHGEQIERDFFEWLSEQSFTFNPERKEGCVVHFHCFPNSSVGVTCMGESVEEAKQFLEKFRTAVASFAENYVAANHAWLH